MEKLKLKIFFKSGNTVELVSNEYYKGQFKEWCVRNFVKNEFQRHEFIIWNDLFVNISEIEQIKCLNE